MSKRPLARSAPGGSTSGPPETLSRVTVSPEAMLSTGFSPASKKPQWQVSGLARKTWCCDIGRLLRLINAHPKACREFRAGLSAHFEQRIGRSTAPAWRARPDLGILPRMSEQPRGDSAAPDYRHLAGAEKAPLVRGIFDSVAQHYDL